MQIHRTHLLVGLAASSMLHASPRRAQADTVCGSAPAGWNAPSGAAVFSTAPGPIQAVIDAVGGYRSHSMLSRGPGGWVTHATSVTPHHNGDTSPYLTPFCSSCGSECWNPLDPGFLTHSMPGLETIDQGAIYTFLYLDGAPAQYLTWQAANNATGQSAIGNDYLGGGMAWAGWWSATNSTQPVWGQSYHGVQIPYGWYQFMNVQSVPQGVAVGSANGNPTGVVCSSALSLWQHDTLFIKGQADVSPRTYSNEGSAGGVLAQAANALWSSVQSSCDAQDGWWASLGSFFTNLGYQALCVGSGESDPCSAAADQMVNCFVANHCGNTSGPGDYDQGEWHGITSNPWAQAVTIAPDEMAGFSDHGLGGGGSVWAGSTPQQVQWNSSGALYGCWDSGTSIGASVDAPGTPTVPAPNQVFFYRLYNGRDHMGSLNAYEAEPSYHFEAEEAWLYTSAAAAPAPAHAIYRCLVGGWDHMESTSATCEGQTVESTLGYLLDSPTTGSAPLYRCRVASSGDHFDSKSSTCEGQIVEYVLGYTDG